MFSLRIEAIANKVAPYTIVADIGCDHGLLMIELLTKHKIQYIYGIDNKNGPLSQAKNNLEKFEMNNYELILSSGLHDVSNDTQCVVIAGMGSSNIVDIISKDIIKLDFIQRFVIDSHKDIPLIRKYLSNLSYKIVDEEVIFDKNKYYEIITFDKTNEVINYTNDEIEFGPILLKEKSDMFYQKWNCELDKYKELNQQNKNEQLVEKINKIERVLCK